MPIPGVSVTDEGETMRQWELFGITDDDPYWTPPRASDIPVAIAFVPDLDDENEEALLPEPA
jgi:hypothetical protein